MWQIYYNIFMMYILPAVVGLLLGLCMWKVKKSYILSQIMLFVGVLWWSILPHVNNHGSEGAGILALMYSHLAIFFAVTDGLKHMIRKCMKGKSK